MAPAVQCLLSRCGVLPTDLEGIGVALGPGSFTSLRIGLAIAKGMALALHLPVIGVPSLDVLVAGQPVKPAPGGRAAEPGAASWRWAGTALPVRPGLPMARPR